MRSERTLKSCEKMPRNRTEWNGIKQSRAEQSRAEQIRADNNNTD
jgi:hypothetical protein